MFVPEDVSRVAEKILVTGKSVQKIVSQEIETSKLVVSLLCKPINYYSMSATIKNGFFLFHFFFLMSYHV